MRVDHSQFYSEVDTLKPDNYNDFWLLDLATH